MAHAEVLATNLIHADDDSDGMSEMTESTVHSEFDRAWQEMPRQRIRSALQKQNPDIRRGTMTETIRNFSKLNNSQPEIAPLSPREKPLPQRESNVHNSNTRRDRDPATVLRVQTSDDLKSRSSSLHCLYHQDPATHKTDESKQRESEIISPSPADEDPVETSRRNKTRDKSSSRPSRGNHDEEESQKSERDSSRKKSRSRRGSGKSNLSKINAADYDTDETDPAATRRKPQHRSSKGREDVAGSGSGQRESRRRSPRRTGEKTGTSPLRNSDRGDDVVEEEKESRNVQSESKSRRTWRNPNPSGPLPVHEEESRSKEGDYVHGADPDGILNKERGDSKSSLDDDGSSVSSRVSASHTSSRAMESLSKVMLHQKEALKQEKRRTREARLEAKALQDEMKKLEQRYYTDVSKKHAEVEAKEREIEKLKVQLSRQEMEQKKIEEEDEERSVVSRLSFTSRQSKKETSKTQKLEAELKSKDLQLAAALDEVKGLNQYVEALQAALDVTSARLKDSRPEKLLKQSSQQSVRTDDKGWTSTKDFRRQGRRGGLERGDSGTSMGSKSVFSLFTSFRGGGNKDRQPRKNRWGSTPATTDTSTRMETVLDEDYENDSVPRYVGGRKVGLFGGVQNTWNAAMDGLRGQRRHSM